MNSILLWIGGLLVAVLGLLFAVPHIVDWNAYRGVFEEEASRILGRDVRVGGKVNLRLLPSPYVRFEKVRISDAGASLGEPFFRAEAFTLWLSPTPLLKGAVEASEVEFDRPVLRLAVDAEGRGNWQDFRIAPGALPFVPSEVVLQQVRIKEGIVSLRTPGVTEPLELSAIDGEVSAASLKGPYRFRGMVAWQGARRELRIGTSQLEADGKLRYKASIRSPSNGNSYLVDGELSEISAKAQHTGTLTARLPLSGMLEGLLPTDARSVSERGGEMVELRGGITGDLHGARLTDLTFAFEHRGKPQLIGGEILASWRNGLRLETRLASRWLDLDALLGQAGGNAPPVATVRRVIEQASSMLPDDGTSLVTIDVDQVTLGGEALSGVRLALARSGGLTSIGELRANLPGNARGSLRGKLGAAARSRAPAAQGGKPEAAEVFDGEVVLRGTSYRRFATWAGATGIATGQDGVSRPDEAFSIASRIHLLPAGLGLDDTRLEFGGRQLTGKADWRWGDNRSLDISVKGHTIDFAAFAPGTLDVTPSEPDGQPASDKASRASGFPALARLSEQSAAIERAVGRLRVHLEAGEVLDGPTRLRDVAAELSFADGGIAISSLGLTNPSGAVIELSGDLSALQSKPAGTLRGWARAIGPAATATLRQALPAGARRITGDWLSSIESADIGFSLTLGGASPDQALLRVDGLLGGTPSVLELGLDGGLARWPDAPIRLALDIDGQDAAASLLRRMGGRSGTAPSGANTTAAASAPPSRGAALRIRAYGANAASLIADARLAMGAGPSRTNAGYVGRVALSPAGEIELAGEIDLRSANAADLLVLASPAHRPLLPGVAVSGKLELQRKSGVTELTASGLDVGSRRLAGRIALSTRANRTRIDGQLSTDELSILGLMGLLLDGDAKTPDAGPAAVTAGEGPSPWPAAPFSLSLLDNAEGQITILAPVAALAEGLELASSETRLAFGPRRLEIQSITGAALGGRFTARGTIESGAAGAGLSLEARLTGADLTRLAGGSDGGRGDVSATVNLTGRALSPRAVIATAVGNGTIEIRNARVRGVSPTLVGKTASTLIDSTDTVDRTVIERAFAAERSHSITTIGTRRLTVEILDGALRIAPLEITTPDGDLRNVTTLDLTRLEADSEWQIVPRRAAQQQSRGASPQRTEQPLPSISLIWTGPLGTIARLEPRLSIDNLEREIQIRKMERDAERLEELRRQDEERVRLDQERQRQLQLQLQNVGERSGAAPSPAGNPTAATPPIEAPLPLPGSAQDTTLPKGQPPGTGSEAAPPPPRIVRPPSRPRAETKTLQDMLMGQ
jgi:uncharacterized protein involved in outer membrane biogenesis